MVWERWWVIFEVRVYLELKSTKKAADTLSVGFIMFEISWSPPPPHVYKFVSSQRLFIGRIFTMCSAKTVLGMS
jgi:hypothetical protein